MTIGKNASAQESMAGKMVYIRHATEWDLDTIRNERIAGGMEMPEVDPAQIVVAAEEDRIIGFGIIGRASAEGSMCVTVFEKKDRRGIGMSIVRHAIEASELTGLPQGGSEPSQRVVFSKKRHRDTSNQGWTSSACTVSTSHSGTGPHKRK